MDIKNALIELTKGNISPVSTIGEVIGVDADEGTCDVMPFDGSPEIYNVLITPDANNAFVSIPKVGSTVVVNFFDKNNAYIAMFSEIDRYQVKTADGDLGELLIALVDAILNITQPSPAGPTTKGLINMTDFTKIKENIKKIFK
jgi:hypothetical protein